MNKLSASFNAFRKKSGKSYQSPRQLKIVDLMMMLLGAALMPYYREREIEQTRRS